MEILVVNTIRAIRTLWTDPQFKSLTRLVLIAITSGTVFYWLVEGLRPVDALYFSVTTLTTVGYGDFSPETTAGKLFTIVYVLVGVGLLLAFLGRVAGQVVTTAANDRDARNGHGLPARVAQRAIRRRNV
jgi:voltage-gated potassium channel Kch